MSARNGRRAKNDRRQRRRERERGAGLVQVVIGQADGSERVEWWPADHPVLREMRHNCATCQAAPVEERA